jgi:hypothetical protein
MASEQNFGATNGCKGKARETLPLGCMYLHEGKICQWLMLCKTKKWTKGLQRVATTDEINQFINLWIRGGRQA